MAPVLKKVILNGASRHSLRKGFILLGDEGRPISMGTRDRVALETNRSLAQRPDLIGFGTKGLSSHPTLLELATPFLPVYDSSMRDAFLNSLTSATSVLLQTARSCGCRIMATGVNPFFSDGHGQPIALCGDLHLVEVFDDGEIERIYNLFRQYLPELLAVSANSSIYGGTIQKDFSFRMRSNPSSFLPRYLSQFSAEHLDKLERMMRKDYGLGDLRQMDVNPLGGDAASLMQASLSLLGGSPAAVELRFVDAQSSHPFVRAQIILFQSIAMYGRALAREGKRLPYMRDEVLDENKVLAVQDGAGAILKPDPKFKKDEGGHGFWYHDLGVSERASTSLVTLLTRFLLRPLQDLSCQAWELAPILLGAELRRRGKRCLVNYAEYQQFVYYTYPRQFPTAFQAQIEQMLGAATVDPISSYNRSAYADLSAEIEREWSERLVPHLRKRESGAGPARIPKKPRVEGRVKWFDKQKAYGFIEPPSGKDLYVHKSALEDAGSLEPGQAVSFEIVQSDKGPKAIRVRKVLEE